jgi:ribonuclease Z
MLDIVFLGTGSGVPSTKRKPAAIWLQYGEEAMLWDCGEGTQMQMMKARTSFMRMDRIFITHWHADHWAGLIGLMQTMNMEGRKKALHIHGPEAGRFVSDLLDLDYWGPRFRVIAHDVPWEGNDFAPVHEAKDYTIYSIPVKHSVPAVGYAFHEHDVWNVDIVKANKLGLYQGPKVGELKRKGKVAVNGKTITMKDVGYLKKGIQVAYTGDTEPCKNLEKLCHGIDMIIHDATFMEENESRMHGDVKAAARLAKKCGAKELVLTHFSRRYTDVEPLGDEARKIFPSTRVARDLMRVQIKKSSR